MKKRTALTAAVGLSLAMSLSSCASSDAAGDGGESGTTKITFAHWGNNAEAETLKSMIAAFEQAHPDIDVEDQWIQADYEQKLQTTIAGGDQPTVAQISNTSLAGFAKAFKTVDVDPSAYASQNTAKSMQYDGEYKAVPFVVKTKVMAVNEDVFSKAGVQPPTGDAPITPAEFATLAQSVTSGQVPDKTYGSARLWYNGWLIAEGGSFYNEDGTQCTLDSSQAVQAAKDVIAAQEPDGYAPTSLDAEGQDMFDWLSVGRLAMQPDFGPWDIAKLTALQGANIDLVPVPGKGEPIEFNGLGISASADDAEAKAAETFADFMSTDTAAQDLLTTETSSLGLPVVEASIPTFLKAAPDLNLQAFVDAVDQSVVTPSVAKDPQIQTAFNDAITSRTALGAGNEDPATVLADFNTTCQSMLGS